MISRATLDEAVARGILTPAQRDALVALGDESALQAEQAVSEAPRGFNAVTVAYVIGAVAVVFAFGWFLFERWSSLGAGGVLVVTAAYAVLFVVAARMLARHGFALASAVAMLLAVGMTPVITWAILALAGAWYDPSVTATRLPPGQHAVREATRWLPIDVATFVVGLVALWRVRAGVLALPVALAALYASFHLVPVLFDPAIALRVNAWMALFTGSLLLLAAYAADRRQPSSADYAQWFYVAGLGALAFGVGDVWSAFDHLTPHVVALLSVGAIAVSLYLNRRVFLVFGALGAIAYLAYLAFSVFRKTLGFSIVLAGFGLTVILLTVWLQRRYPVIARRLAASQGESRRFLPGGYAIFGLLAALTFVLLVTSPPRAVRAQRELDERTRQVLEQQRRRDSLAGRQPVPR